VRKTLIVTALFLPAVVFASGHEAAGGETDFLPRLVNFIIFAAILYYFVADLIKNFFTGRSKEISSKLEEVQNRLKATKKKQKRMLKLHIKQHWLQLRRLLSLQKKSLSF